MNRVVTPFEPDLATLRKEYTLVDMHVHTAYSHDCATKPEAIAKKLRELNIGAAITDHNVIGGAMELSTHDDLFIIPGIEVTSKERKDLLIYFNTPRALEHFYQTIIAPNLKRQERALFSTTKLPLTTIIDEARQYDCLISIPHPFATRPKNAHAYFSQLNNQDALASIDAIEVLNQTQSVKANLASLGWAVQEGKVCTGGSDAHVLSWLGKAVTATKGTTPSAFLEAIKEGNAFIFGKQASPTKRFSNLPTIFTQKANTLLKGARRRQH